MHVSENAKNRTRAFEYMNSTVGKRFLLIDMMGHRFEHLRGLDLSDNFLTYMDRVAVGNSSMYPNPEYITLDGSGSSERVIRLACEDTSNTDKANITNIIVSCFELRAPAHRTDSGDPWSSEAGSKWAAPLYSCATAFKASVKTVTFQLQPLPASSSSSSSSSPAPADPSLVDLSSLKVLNIEPKSYSSSNAYPVWGVENTNLTVEEIRPLWGIVSKAYTSEPRLSTVQQPYLYLPGRRDEMESPSNFNLPGLQFHTNIVSGIITGGVNDFARNKVDYTGLHRVALLKRWRELSNKTETAGKIIDLLWTDMAQSAVAGARGVLGHQNMQPEHAVRIEVAPLELKIKFDWRFSVPAALLVLLTTLITLGGVVAACWTRRGLNTLRLALRKASTGRLMTMFLDPESSNLLMGDKEWNRMNGHKMLYLRAVPPSGPDGEPVQEMSKARHRYQQVSTTEDSEGL
ncbi:hypothetical protein VTJ49DRAFT_4707 [Mycothermus thermophilus]|uniref:Uncharacterized protein n=1 Tax=Humicola insolens TaxID=85995 RepID=A0ABR3V5Z9_HUMIN